MSSSTKMSLPNARPYGFTFPPATTALIIIDMQRDFVDPNGFGSIQCGNPEIFSAVRNIVPTLQKVLEVARSIGLRVIHTREGHRPDLSDLPPSKKVRQVNAPHGHHTMGIGDQGPMGRLLVRGEWGHDIIDELRQLPGEPVIDKPGKGSYWGTDLHRILLARGITHILFSGVTTECCVTTTLRECNDRGFECCILSDCTGGFDQQMVTTSMDIICGQDGLFGYVGNSIDFLSQAAKSQALTPPSTPPATEDTLQSIPQLQKGYKSGLLDPEFVVSSVFERIERYKNVDSAVWISIESKETVLKSTKALSDKYAGKPLPSLYGVPFALKDNIDVEGAVTTATCETFAYVANTTALAVQLLLDAGAIYIGKLNMDQLATGLSGCRSPYGTPHSVHSKDHISGGSSSGSAVAVAAGLVSFTLGTDTAGSGRVPAALNGIVGFKPTKGTISARGTVPACKSLDTLSVMAPTLAEAREVWYVIDSHDALDPFAKSPLSLSLWKSDFRGPREGGFTFAIPPPSALSTCSKEYQTLFDSSVQRLRSCGGRLVEIDYTPFALASDLLYNASLVQERIASIGHEFLLANLESLHPTTKSLFLAALESDLKPWQVFQDQAFQTQYTMQAQRTFDILKGGIDALLVPSTPCHPTIQEMESDPLDLNAKMGTFTHAGNVVDLCGVSVNAAWTEAGLPFGVTFLGGSGYDGRILDIATVFEQAVKSTAKS
ncbi:amidase signature domain-containing protein [Amylocarpus encephaloides]|uniref:Amidase signature domain-containing protein n=1 Tax=Amylocarpus encephaloides TaxID=45428 RepID=A0A9P8C8M0_9HELO|nr:amidase signature domain-containing protein [Amylocarpus encephaloides]